MLIYVIRATIGVNAAFVLFFPRYGHILANYTRLQRRVQSRMSSLAAKLCFVQKDRQIFFNFLILNFSFRLITHKLLELSSSFLYQMKAFEKSNETSSERF